MFTRVHSYTAYETRQGPHTISQNPEKFEQR